MITKTIDTNTVKQSVDLRELAGRLVYRLMGYTAERPVAPPDA